MDEPNDAQGQKSQGGIGGNLFTRPYNVRSDCKLIERYATTETERAALIARLREVLTREDLSVRDRAAIAKAYATLDRVTLDFMRFERENQKEAIDEEHAATLASRVLRQMAAMRDSVPHASEEETTT